MKNKKKKEMTLPVVIATSIVVVIIMVTLAFNSFLFDGIAQEDISINTTVTETITTEVTTLTSNSTSNVETTTTTTNNTTTNMTSSSTEITTIKAVEDLVNEYTPTSYLFYEDSMRVHTLDCIYADTSCMKEITGEYIDYARPCSVCNPDIEIGTLYEPEPVIEENYQESSEGNLERNWTVSEMTYYSGSYGCYGASGRTLINNYSVACNSIPLGTIVYIKSSDGSIDGYYRVDDTGEMGNHIIDIFYSDYSNTPSSFRQLGRVSCEVYIVN